MSEKDLRKTYRDLKSILAVTQDAVSIYESPDLLEDSIEDIRDACERILARLAALREPMPTVSEIMTPDVGCVRSGCPLAQNHDGPCEAVATLSPRCLRTVHADTPDYFDATIGKECGLPIGHTGSCEVVRGAGEVATPKGPGTGFDTRTWSVWSAHARSVSLVMDRGFTDESDAVDYYHHRVKELRASDGASVQLRSLSEVVSHCTIAAPVADNEVID